MVRILVLHGPNLNLLGRREPSVYGSITLEAVNALLTEWARARDVTLRIEQTNHEGVMIDLLHECAEWADGVVINPGGYAHTSIALADAVRAVGLPAIEVHLTNIFAREPLRRRSLLAPACVGVVAGLAEHGYVAACAALVEMVEARKGRGFPPHDVEAS